MAVVNTVNIVGIMGKGIALMFKERFPKNYREYVDASKTGAIQIGKCLSRRLMKALGQNGLSISRLHTKRSAWRDRDISARPLIDESCVSNIYVI